MLTQDAQKNILIKTIGVVVAASVLCTPYFAYSQSAAQQTATTATSTAPLVGAMVRDSEIDILKREILQRQSKIKQLQATIDAYKQNIAAKQNEAASLKATLSVLDNHVAELNAEIQQTNEKIKSAQLEIDALELEIAAKDELIAKQKLIVSSLVRAVHASDQKNYLEILLSYRSFAEFYDDLEQTQHVSADLGRALTSIRQAREQQQAKRQQVAARQATYKALQEELDAKKLELQDQTAFKQDLLVQTKASEARYETLLSSQRREYQLTTDEINGFEDKVRKKLSEQNLLSQGAVGELLWPVPSHIINAYFHDATYPFKNVFQHSGIDIKAPHGTAIRAVNSGYVARARRCSVASCYAYVLIVHTETISSLYGHMSQILVNDDQYVNKGDIIGYSGGTPGTVGAGPFVTGPHLHFEVRQNGIPVDPLGYISP